MYERRLTIRHLFGGGYVQVPRADLTALVLHVNRERHRPPVLVGGGELADLITYPACLESAHCRLKPGQIPHSRLVAHAVLAHPAVVAGAVVAGQAVLLGKRPHVRFGPRHRAALEVRRELSPCWRGDPRGVLPRQALPVDRGHRHRCCVLHVPTAPLCMPAGSRRDRTVPTCTHIRGVSLPPRAGPDPARRTCRTARRRTGSLPRSGPTGPSVPPPFRCPILHLGTCHGPPANGGP